MPEIISDSDGVYYARMWRRFGANLDETLKRDLVAWVRSKPPSKILAACNLQLSNEEVLALLDEVERCD